MSSVQLLDKTRKIGKLLHNNNSSKVVFNDICKVMRDIVDSNVLVISKKGKVLGVGNCEKVEELKELSLRQITYTMHAPDIVKYRKLLTIEQFHNERIVEVATMHFVTGLESLYTMIFEKMMEKGILKQEDSAFLAFEYMAPVAVMIHQCDRQPEWEEKAMERIRVSV